MASSSDTANAVRGFVPPQNDDERRLMRRVEELCRVAVSRGIPRYTGFLSDREQSLAQAACNKAGCSCIRFWGGFDAAERRVLCIEPPDAWQEEPLAYLQCTAYGDKLPTHRDYLGAILGLGLERSCVGDLLADPEREDTFYAVILADKQEFINAELTGAGHCTVHTACIDALPVWPKAASAPCRRLPCRPCVRTRCWQLCCTPPAPARQNISPRAVWRSTTCR